MLWPGGGALNQAWWQFYNQSYNSAVFFANKNKSSEVCCCWRRAAVVVARPLVALSFPLSPFLRGGGGSSRRLLRRAVLSSNKPIDHVLDYETLTGRLLSFHADPPLAYTSSSKMSTLAY